ncbi:protein mono-ADP-ribosyltransferase PARP14-like isoform X2 [Channa argus]|uniref:protein mono-ADP-ribosyltransferase PARP14-like isoform X2 n=1 Tax=Channa argus TaxID=215402 RepID=UPI0035203275
MEGCYRYPVFFECPGLDGDQKKRIEKYFQIRRKSGGGDCGSVTNINDNVYSIAFKEIEAQQRVLERFKHELEFADGHLVITVQNTPGPYTSSPITTSPLSQSETSSQQPILATKLAPSDEQYEVQCDAFLLSYLHECPKALNKLQEKLTTVFCSAQIYPGEERVLVRSLAKPDAADEGRNWKSEVDKIFDGYQCHYEVDPHKVKALLQSCSSNQTTDEVKVYSEGVMAIVVGEHSQVDAILMNIEHSTVKRRASSLREKQSSVHRVGEAKLRLLWKDIKQHLGQDFPEVTITQGNPGDLVLEGFVEDIVKALAWVSDKEKCVLESALLTRSLLFLDFVRKAYGGPGMLRNFLGISNEVEIELRDTELRFFTLSADKLSDSEKKLQENFKEVKIVVPNCSGVQSELQEMLKSKTNEINQGQFKVRVVFISDNTVYLLGLTKEVDELNETVMQYVLDHSSIEGKVILPFPKLAHQLTELLQLHKFDYSGVVFHSLTTSSEPMVVLEGPSSKVTEVRNRLGSFLDSLVQTRVTIDLPGAIRYFQSSSGRENILSITHSQKCLIQLQDPPSTPGENWASGTRLNNGNIIAASYSLCEGLQVLVCQGDITKQEVDALVNAANEDLDHCGGVAAALSKAGGPEVQKESKALVKQTGKVATGSVVVTTGGNLKCKKLLHAVGPVAGKAGGRERFLLEKTITSALNLAEIMEFKTIAIPCISSGVFGVPVTVCAEAIVTAVKAFGSQRGRSLSTIILIDNRGEAVRAMREACDRLLQGISTENSTPSGLEFQIGAAPKDTARRASSGAPEDGVHVDIIQGTIEDQQVDCLVSPMAGHDPLSTLIGNILSNLVGPQLTAMFHKESGGGTISGDKVLVQGLPVLQAKAVIFLNLASWDNNQHGTAVQVLRKGLRNILTTCESRGFTSVALPVLGAGSVLRFPHSVATKVVLEEVKAFEQNRATSSPFLVRIVIHTSDKESSKAFQSAQETLHLRGFTNDANPDKASFYRHVSIRNDEVTATLGGVKLQMVFGDIVNEATDAIVNTTDFSNNKSGVSKAILDAAGPTVRAEFARVGTPPDCICTTGPGLLHSKEIIHASFKRDPQVIRRKCKNILKHCESKRYHSVAFPAVNTGAAGMDSDKACKAMLDGLTLAISDLKPISLSLIRIVILQQQVFRSFKSELENRYGLIASCHVSMREKAKQQLKKWQEKPSRTSRFSTSEDLIFSKPQPAVINVICCGQDKIETIKSELEGILLKQLVEREEPVHNLSKLDDMELEAVLVKVRVSGISVEHKRHQSSEIVKGNRAGNAARAGARTRSGSAEDVYVLKGLKEDVLSITEFVNKSINKALYRDLQEKEEAMMALTIQWSIQDVNEVWHELSLRDNYMLEDAHMNQQVSVDITAHDGIKVKVNLITQEATDWLTGLTYKMKRINDGTTLELPKQWDPMHQEVFKKVKLQPNSPEYQDIAEHFHRTARYNIEKIERVQNVYLWHAYAVCRQRILTKNGSAELGEKLLYHGTSAKSCDCIERDRFDRSYAGAHGEGFCHIFFYQTNKMVQILMVLLLIIGGFKLLLLLEWEFTSQSMQNIQPGAFPQQIQQA